MNSTRTSSYKKIHPSNEKRNETMKSNVHQEDLRINGFHIEPHHFSTEGIPKNTSKNSSASWTSQSRPEQKLEDEIQEVSLQMTTRSVTRLQGQNVSENTTVLKVCSKTALKENELIDDQFSQKEATSARSSPSRRNKIHQANNKVEEKLRSLYSQVEDLCVSCAPKKRKNQPRVKETRTARPRNEDPLFNYSLKLMEIYLKRYNADSDKGSSREPSPVKPLPKKKRYGSNSTMNVYSSNSKGVEGCVTRTRRKKQKSCSLIDDTFVEPTRDRQNTDDLEECLNDKKKINSETNERIESGKCLSKALKLKKTCARNENSNTESNNFDLNNVHFLEDEKLTNVTSLNAEEDLLDKVNRNSSFQKFNGYDKKLIPECDNCEKIDNVNALTIEDDILTKAKERDETEDLGAYSDTDFIKTEEFRSNQVSVKSNESEILRPSPNSEDLESMEVYSNEENPENKQENFNEDAIDDVGIDLSNENVQSMTIDDEKEKEQDSQGARLEMTVNEIDSLTSGTIMQEVTENDDDYKDINICKMLTDVHEQLTYDLQRMKRMEAKLQGKVSVDATNLTTALQLLDRTVARCKSYIHDSSNNQEAELYIAKVLSVYGVQLVTAVNKNKAALDEQAQQIERMELGRNIYNKKNVFKEINSSWNYWKKEIIFLIEIIYNWVKHVMMNNEEKENVKSLRKYKNIHRRTANNLFTYDLKSKPGDGRVKGAKFDLKLIKNESVVDTQMSVASHLINCLKQSKSKASEKPFNSVVNRERGKTQNDAQMIEKRTIDKGKSTKDPIRNKYRAFGNQPVWRPGGIVKIPASSSATTLQKARPSTNVKEKVAPLTEHARTEKPNKTTNASKKKVLNDALSMKDVTVHPRKAVGKKSNTSLRISPKMKSKPGTPKAMPRNCNEPVNFENKSSQDDSHEKDLQNSKALRTSEEKGSVNNNQEQDTGNTIQGDSTIFEPPLEPILPEKMVKDLYDNKEEPTRDMDPNRQQKQTTEKSLDTLSLYKNPLDLPKTIEYNQPNPSKKIENVIDTGINTSLERFQSNRYPNFVSVVSKSCLTNFSSNSDCTSKLECRTSFNSTCSSCTSNLEQKSDRLNLPVRDEDKDESMVKREKSGTNSHAMLLNMLKEFLCEQGVDVGLVNKAEQKVKDKQKHRRYSKRKSSAFTTGFFSAQDDQSLQEVAETERLLQMEEENIDREKDSKITEEEGVVDSENRFECTENSKGDGINWEKDLKRTENVIKDDVNREKNCRTAKICERGIQYIEDVTSCEESCKESVISLEKDSKSTEIDEKNIVNREKGSRNTEEEEKVINCENDLNHTETVTNREKEVTNTGSYEENLRPTEIYEDKVISSKKDFNYTEHHKGNIVNCAENVLKPTGSYEENDIECQKNSSQAEENNYKNILDDIKKYIANYPPENRKDNLNIKNVPLQPKMKDAWSYIRQKSSDISSQTDSQHVSLKSFQTMTQMITKDVKNIATECSTRNLTTENRTVSVMVESFPVDSKDNTRAPCVSKSVTTEHVGCVFSKSFDKPIHENLKEKSNSFFLRLLNQMQEGSRGVESTDASKEVSFAESNVSTLFTSSDSSSKSLKDSECDEKVIKETNTSPIKIVSSETMAAFQVFAIRIQNIYKAVEIYQRKLRTELKRTEKKLKSNKAAKVCKEKPCCVSKSSSVDMIFRRNDKVCKDSVIQMYEAFRQTEAESMFDEESSYVSDDDEQEVSESLASSTTTMWSYESASGKVELKISGKLSDTVVLRDVTHLMEFLVQKTEDSVLEKTNSVKKMSNNARTKNRYKRAQFSLFSRKNLLPLIYGIVCYVVFWCLHFRITCDIVL